MDESIKNFNHSTTETLSHHRQQIAQNQNDFFKKSNQLQSQFIKEFSKKTDQKNTELTINILEKINSQFSEFLKDISNVMNTHNSVFIKQNADIIKLISEQPSYQSLHIIRENLIIIKTTLTILEKLNKSELQIFHNLYLQYQQSYPKIPVLDVNRGVIIIKILFPSFFSGIIKNLTNLKSQMNDESYKQSIDTISDTVTNCNSFFKNFNHSEIKQINQNLQADIQALDEILVKIIP